MGPTGLSCASGPNPNGLSDLSFRPDGTLFGIKGPIDWQLYTFNLGTGVASLVGPVANDVGGNGLSFNPPTLYQWGFATQYVVSQFGGGATVDTVLTENFTGGCQRIRIAAADFDNTTGTMYGILKCNQPPTGDERLVIISIPTGVLTEVGTTTPFMDAIAVNR